MPKPNREFQLFTRSNRAYSNCKWPLETNVPPVIRCNVCVAISNEMSAFYKRYELRYWNDDVVERAKYALRNNFANGSVRSYSAGAKMFIRARVQIRNGEESKHVRDTVG